MTIEHEPPRGAGPGALGAEVPGIAAGKTTRSAKLGSGVGDAPPGINVAPGYSFYPPFDGTSGGATGSAADGADDPFALHLNAGSGGAPTSSSTSVPALAQSTTPLGPATRLSSAASDVSEVALRALHALHGRAFHDAQIVELKDNLGLLGDALHEYAGERSDSDEKALRRALRDARAVANELTRRHTGRTQQDDSLWRRIELIERLAENRTEVVETPHMPQVLAEFVNESFAQLTSVRNTLAKVSDVLPEVDLAELDESIVTTSGWQDTVTNPATSRTQLLHMSKAIVDQHEILPKAIQGLELVLREPLTPSSGKVVAAYVHAMALSTKRRTLAEVALDQARKLRRQKPLDVANEALEGDEDIVIKLGSLDRAQGRQAERENDRLENRKLHLEQRIKAGQHVSRTEIDELNVEARENAFKHHLALLSTNANLVASGLDRMDDGVIGWLAKPDGVTIPRLVDDLRGLSRVTAAAMAGYRERVDNAKEELEVGDIGDRHRVAQAKAEALDWAEGFMREWLETGYYDERIKKTEAVMADVEMRAMLANFAIILATMLVGNFAGSLAARGVTAARGAAVATEVTMGTEAMATVASVTADATASAGMQKLATNDPTSFGTLLATNLAVPLAVAPISRHFRNIDDVYKSGAKATTLWQKAGRLGSWGIRRGVELNLEMVAGAAADYMVRRAASADGPPPNEQTKEQWLLQGASIAVGRFVHGASNRIGEHYSQRKTRNAEIAQRSNAVAELGKMAEDGADVRSAVEALGEYKKLLEADQDALVAELEITHEANPAHGDLMKRIAQNQREQGQLDHLGLENLAMRGGGLRPKGDGDEVWEGDSTQVQEALVLARSLGLGEVRARYDQKQRRWNIEFGTRKFEVQDTHVGGDVPAHARTTAPMDAVNPDAIPTALPDEPTAKVRRPESGDAPPAAKKRPYERAHVPDEVEAAIARPENLLDLVNRRTGVTKDGFSDRVDNIAKGPAYDEAMSELREFYTQMQGEAEHVTKNRGHVHDGPNYEWEYAHDARTFSHGLSSVEFRVHLQREPGIGDDVYERVKKRVQSGVDSYYNFKHGVRGQDGVERRLHVEVVFVDKSADAHIVVSLKPMNGISRAMEWYAGAHPTTDAHEVAHGAFGMRDEYWDSRGRPPGRETPNGPGVAKDGSLMGDYWTDETMSDVQHGTGLRQRHLDEISGFLPGLAKSDPQNNPALHADTVLDVPSRGEREPSSPRGLFSVVRRRAAVRELETIGVTKTGADGTVKYFVDDAELDRMYGLLPLVDPSVTLRTTATGFLMLSEGQWWHFERSSTRIAKHGEALTEEHAKAAEHAGQRFGIPAPNASVLQMFVFHGVKTVHDVPVDQLQGDDLAFYESEKKRAPLLYYGHAGFSIDGGKTIWGFTPDRSSRPDLTDQQFLDFIRKNGVADGLVLDDSYIFRDAESHAKNRGWSTKVYEATQILDDDFKLEIAAEIQSMSTNEGRGAGKGHGKKYQFPYKLPNARGKHYADDCTRNCATFHEFLGIQIPEETGLFGHFVPALRKWAEGLPLDLRRSSIDEAK